MQRYVRCSTDPIDYEELRSDGSYELLMNNVEFVGESDNMF